MKHYIDKKIPAKTIQHLDYIECDLCKKKDRNWKKDSYDVVDIDVSWRSGCEYPDYGHGETVLFDICPDCFENKLIPWMISQGATPTTKEWEH